MENTSEGLLEVGEEILALQHEHPLAAEELRPTLDHHGVGRRGARAEEDVRAEGEAASASRNRAPSTSTPAPVISPRGPGRRPLPRPSAGRGARAGSGAPAAPGTPRVHPPPPASSPRPSAAARLSGTETTSTLSSSRTRPVGDVGGRVGERSGPDGGGQVAEAHHGLCGLGEQEGPEAQPLAADEGHDPPPDEAPGERVAGQPLVGVLGARRRERRPLPGVRAPLLAARHLPVFGSSNFRGSAA